MEEDLKIEREWRERLQVKEKRKRKNATSKRTLPGRPFFNVSIAQETNIADRETINKLKQETDFLRQVSNDYDNIR